MSMKTYDYKFESLLGTGTFGMVYLVTRRKDGKPFVIKEQDVSVKATASSKMVLEEIQCLQKMRHPNIVSYHGAWLEGNRSYILMEYATRGTLKDLLARRKVPLKEADALYLFSQIVLGVHHIHTKKILHRDLKPENIMLTGRRGDIIKLGDFGISKNVEKELAINRAGSYYYMAPEMLKDQVYDFKCDIWSMGVILYEMVENVLPFPAKNQAEIIDLVCKGKPRALSKRTSTDVLRLISKMLRKEAAYRPRASQLVLCPFLVSYVSRVYLNVGRSAAFVNAPGQTASMNFGPHIFQNYLKQT